MFRGFNIELNQRDSVTLMSHHTSGLSLYKEFSGEARTSLNRFLGNDSTLDGDAIKKAWFPEVKADIFISHSRNDKDNAIALAGWLWDNFKLKAFIDYCVWGHSSELQLLIDKDSCEIEKGRYDYDLRNHSTSHVNIMLSVALSMMIDKAECLFFLNTPYSVKSYGKTDKTESPWIYSEMTTSKLIEKKNPVRYITESFSEGGRLDKAKLALRITHDLDLDHLVKIDFGDLRSKWLIGRRSGEHALDTLYRTYPAPEK